MLERAHLDLMMRFQKYQNNPAIQKLKTSYIASLSSVTNGTDMENLQEKLNLVSSSNAAVSQQLASWPFTQQARSLRGGGNKQQTDHHHPLHQSLSNEDRLSAGQDETENTKNAFIKPATSSSRLAKKGRRKRFAHQSPRSYSRESLTQLEDPPSNTMRKSRSRKKKSSCSLLSRTSSESSIEWPDPPLLHETIRKVSKLTKAHLYKSKKLILIVDLDNTIINSTDDKLAENIQDIHKMSTFWTRIRPGAPSLLSQMSKLYEMIICTYGTAQYAADIAHMLDPKKKLFKNRIFSRDDMQNKISKEEILSYLPTSVRDMVVVIDDNIEAWRSTPFIPVEYYQFFSSFDVACPRSWVEGVIGKPGLKVAFNDADNYLPKLAKMLRDIHKACYRHKRPRPKNAANTLKAICGEIKNQMIMKRKREN